jgi:hypothetical protein
MTLVVGKVFFAYPSAAQRLHVWDCAARTTNCTCPDPEILNRPSGALICGKCGAPLRPKAETPEDRP